MQTETRDPFFTIETAVAGTHWYARTPPGDTPGTGGSFLVQFSTTAFCFSYSFSLLIVLPKGDGTITGLSLEWLQCRP